jgi:hypothetical protein
MAENIEELGINALGKRPLADFTRSVPAGAVTKKQSVYLSQEQHQFLMLLSNLPGLQCSLSDLLANVVQAFREDYTPEIKHKMRELEQAL